MNDNVMTLEEYRYQQTTRTTMTTADLSDLKHAQQILALRLAGHGQQINRQSNHTLDDDLLGESRFILEQLDKLEDDIAMLRAVSNVAIRVITNPNFYAEEE